MLANALHVNVRHDWGSPFARFGQGLELDDGPDGMRATVTLPDTSVGRQVRARVEPSASNFRWLRYGALAICLHGTHG